MNTVNLLIILLFMTVIKMSAVLWWLIYAISCFCVFAFRLSGHENMSFVVTSTFAFRGIDTKTRQTKGDNTKYFYPPTRNFQHFSCLRLSKCRYFAQHFSCFRVFAPKVEITTKRHAFVPNGINQPPCQYITVINILICRKK